MACCGAIVIAAEPVTIPLLRRLHAVDTPSGRSSHSVPTPRGGGLPIAVGLLAAVAITRSGASAAFAVAVGFFGVLGFVDDLRGLPAAPPAGAPGHRKCRRCGAARPADAPGGSGRPAGRGRSGMDHRVRQRVQLHGRGERHLRRACTDRRGGLRLLCGVGAAPVPAGRQPRGGRRRADVPAVERRPGPGVPRRRRQLFTRRGPGRAGRGRGAARGAGRGGPRPARPVPGGHRVDAAAAHPGGRALAAGPPDARLPAVVRRWLVAPGGHPADRGPDHPAHPAGHGQPEPGSAGPGRG